jgi:hypothetical protein
MKEQKTMIELVRRYEEYPFTSVEKFGIGMTFVFFFSMAILFFLLPSLPW